MSDKFSADTFFELPEDSQPAADVVKNESDEVKEIEINEGADINGYFVSGVVSTSGNESNVYRVRKGGNIYALKLYKYSFTVSERKMEALKNIGCPYVAALVDYGYFNGRLYEVYEYYENGTLADACPVSPEKLKTYVNQLNIGLNALHSVSAGMVMVHGDIKPSNIFLSDDKESVIIGDFGISTIIDSAEGYGMGAIAGTPEYAPPSRGLVNKMQKTTAFDYGSLGLVIYYMATGYSKFERMSTEAIAKEWRDGIDVGEVTDTRTKMLLQGLLVDDEAARFGFDDVESWYKGSFIIPVNPKEVFKAAPKAGTATLWFGIFNGESIEVSSFKELALQMQAHWEQAKNKIRDDNFYEFLGRIDTTGQTRDEIKKIVDENDEDAAVFKVIYTLYNDSNIVYKGRNYGNASRLMSYAAKDMNDDIKELLLKDLFGFYVRKMEYSAEVIGSINEVLELNGCPDEFKAALLSYMFSEDKKYNGYSSLDDLREAVVNMSLDEINELCGDVNFIAWLYYLGVKEVALTILFYNRGDKK